MQKWKRIVTKARDKGVSSIATVLAVAHQQDRLTRDIRMSEMPVTRASFEKREDERQLGLDGPDGSQLFRAPLPPLTNPPCFC